MHYPVNRGMVQVKNDLPAFAVPSQNGLWLNPEIQTSVYSVMHLITSTKQNVKSKWLLCFLWNFYR
mgnify:CR=1 FL=1